MRLIGSCVLAAFVGLLAASGDWANGAELPAVSQAVAASAPAGHPCGLLTDAEVRRVFPNAARGKPDPRLEKHGIDTCVWDHPGGLFSAQIEKTEPAAPESEIRSRASGSVDPVNRAARGNVRYETLAGVGDRAIAVVERADAQRGILSDMALLVVRRGGRQVVFMSTQLAERDRAAALAALTELGRAAAGRL